MKRRVHWRPARWGVGLAGVALALVGVWGAWVPHRAAALVLSCWDLAEFVKFVPGAAVPRDLFYLPLWCAAIALGVIANQHAGSKRWAGSLLALGLVLYILPPYPHTLNGYRSAEFRWQFVLGIGGALMVLLSLSSGRWPARVVGGALVALALAGTIPALWQFLQVRGEIKAVYGAGLGWGWGLGALLAGWGLVGATGGWLLVKSPL